ncbi:hypothetical protein HHK36_027049 [Tetracentron sinense]|uniref:F-box domain-containing protein n=1 Tax=Tetracentron sinense TaxID=13715 RepID=A0A835D2P1_TETSI|nr:hypothetical protein HHK36_027049 [Tetracentron sinense]
MEFVLPEGCISHILSFTSPADACRLSLISSTFQSAAESDAVWERFLPSDYQEIISRSVSPPTAVFSSKKDLYFRLCSHPILLDDGNMSFALDKRTGKKCYMLGAKRFYIPWGDHPQYWAWRSLPDSRAVDTVLKPECSGFSDVAQLLAVCWLEVCGRMETGILSPRTNYAVYFVFKFADRTQRLQKPPEKVYVFVGGAAEGPHVVDLDPDGHSRQEHQDSQERDADWRQRETELPRERGDGWLEIEMGQFFNDEGEYGEVEMILKGMEGLNWKSGLIIQGIEFRPKT